MTAAIVAIVVIAAGLPLAAFWVGGRRFWNRLKPGAEPSPWRDLVRAHGLSAREASLVADAVRSGRALDEERLRRAAAAWASLQLRSRRPGSARRRRVLLAVLCVLAALYLSAAVAAVATGNAGHVNWFLLAYAPVVGAMAWVRRRRLRRALELNSGPSPSAGRLGEQPR